ncbi:hypothetical protein D9M68_878530 [compost metagenome]
MPPPRALSTPCTGSKDGPSHMLWSAALPIDAPTYFSRAATKLAFASSLSILIQQFAEVLTLSLVLSPFRSQVSSNPYFTESDNLDHSLHI